MKIGILGGTGQAGRRIARLLLQETSCDVVLLGRNAEKLDKIKKEIAQATSKNVESVVIKIFRREQLASVFKGLDLLIIAISSADTLATILDAAMDAHVDCLDILLSSSKKLTLLGTKRDVFRKKDVCYITDGGYHPGVPAAMIMLAEKLCPGLTRAEVFGSFGINWSEVPMSKETAVDFVREIATLNSSAYIDGKWVTSWKNVKRFNFGPDIGTHDCYAFGMDELRSLPKKIPTLRDAGFYIAGFGRLMDWIVMPLTIFCLMVSPSTLPFVARVFDWSLRHFAGRKNWALLKLDGQSATDKISISLSYSDAYELTALPVVACVKQYMDSPKRPGLWHQAHFVDPERFLEDMKNMGVLVEIGH